MKKILNFSLIMFLLLFFAGCTYSSESFSTSQSHVNSRYAGFENISEINEQVAEISQLDGNYKVLILTDIHIGASYYLSSAENALKNWLDSLSEDELSEIKFCLTLGDFAHNGKETQFNDFNRLMDIVRNKKIPVFNAIGNHDLYKNGWKHWKNKCFPHTSTYKFYTKNHVWYCLDSGAGFLGSRQMEGLKTEIERESKIPFIFTHYPLVNDSSNPIGKSFAMRDDSERNSLISLFSNAGVQDYFCGHYHPGDTTKIGDIVQHNLKSFGQMGLWYLVSIEENDVKIQEIK